MPRMLPLQAVVKGTAAPTGLHVTVSVPSVVWKLAVGRLPGSTLGLSLVTVPETVAEPVLTRHTYHWVLALDHQGLSTPKVYAELDRLRAEGDPPRIGPVEPVLEGLASGDPRQLALLLA